MPRYVILRHDWPAPHFDLLLEVGEVLKSWRLHGEPRPGVTVVATPAPDHRKHYLDYEGQVGGGRGTVTRHAAGRYEGDIGGETWTVEWDAGSAELAVRDGQIGFTITPPRTGS